MATCLHCGTPIQVFNREAESQDKLIQKGIKCPHCGIVTPFIVENKNLEKKIEKSRAAFLNKLRNAH